MNPYEWNKSFAWLPVKLTNGPWVWLKPVMKRVGYYSPHLIHYKLVKGEPHAEKP